ncbi:uncharacterized protein [Panulirus ornatus]|uniref:uncharacterized protein n=1 Tax=Panulirus ornatus TaxID=150431 RepID=UPI003A8628DA
MAETSMSMDSLDASLLYLKIGDNTLENLAISLMKSTGDDGVDSGCDRSVGGAANSPLDLSRKSSPDHETEGDPYQHTFKNTRPENNNNINNNNNNNKTNISDNNHNDVNKMWSASMQDLSHTVERTLATGGGVSEDWRTPDLSYMGVTPSLGEMLLQHGEFPASPAFTPMPRYRSTPLEMDAGIYGDSSSMGSRHNDAFAASVTSSLGHQQHPFAQGVGELTYGMCGGGNKKWGPFSKSLMMTTPENLFTDNTPKFSLGQHQGSPASLQSGISWRVGDGEAAWTSLSSCCYSSSSRSSGASLSGKHYNTPVEASNNCSHPQFSDPQYKTARSAPPYGRYQEWSDARSSQLPHNSTISATAAPHNSYAFPYAPHQPQGSRYMQVTGEEKSGGGAPEKVSPRKALIQDVVLRESITAFRSHPLFPLLKDLAVADNYFDKASFSVAPLLAFLPTSTEELVCLYRRRNPEVGHATAITHTPAVDAVIMDAIVYAHTSLLGKVTSHAAKLTASVESEVAEMDALVDEMCHKYMGAVRSSTPLHILHALGTEFPDLSDANGNDKETVKDPQQQFECFMAPFSPIPPSFDASRTSPDSTASAPDSNKKSRFHGREVTDVLTAWLTEHREHPYPDDDDKLLLMQRTGLTAQQVTQWFTNARRRILPKLKADAVKE